MKEKMLISFSGGRTSAYMTWWLMNEWPERYNWEMKVVFANTGKEREETLQFINECDKQWGLSVIWVEANVDFKLGKGTTHSITDFHSASRNGQPFEEVIKKYGIPNSSFPHCTRELKSRPIHSYIKSIGWKNYSTAIGIRVDEFDRMNPDRKKLRYIYPLVTNNVTVKDISIFWSKQPFDLKLKSYQGNCDLCWKKSTPKLDKICGEDPLLIKWWRDMEEKYGHYIPESRDKEKFMPPIRFYRGNKAIDELLAVKTNKYTQADLFEFGCSESCEPF